jgi:transposase
MLPNDFPPWEMVYHQSQRWIAAGVFESIVHDLPALLLMAKGRNSGQEFGSKRTMHSLPLLSFFARGRQH